MNQVLSILMLLVPSYFCFSSILKPFPFLERISLAWGLGIGSISLLLFFFSILGDINFYGIDLVSFQIGFFMFFLVYKRKNIIDRFKQTKFALSDGITFSPVPLIGIIMLCIASLVSALYYPILVSDGLYHFVQGMFLAESKWEILKTFNIAEPVRPLMVPFSYAYFFKWGSNNATLLHVMTYFSLLTCFYFRMLALLEDKKTASCLTLALASTPLFWWHSILGLNNIIATFFFVLAPYICIVSLVMVVKNTVMKQFLRDCFMGLRVG